MRHVTLVALVALVAAAAAARAELSASAAAKLRGDLAAFCVDNKDNNSAGRDVFFVLAQPEASAVLRAHLDGRTRAERRQLVYDWLTEHAGKAQAGLHDLLRERGVADRAVRAMWIVNSVFVRGASARLIAEVAERADVVRVVPDGVVADVRPPLRRDSERPRRDARPATPGAAVQWNVAKIRADQAWGVTNGTGVVVGIVDTGVRFTHEALMANYRGSLDNHDYAWFDPGEFQRDPWWCTPGICSPEECCADYPYDIVGHGSHCAGTAVGQLGIGVAPGATWIAAKGCRDGQCTNYGLTTSAEWMLCPTKLDGSAPNCALGPDVVSNSWGSGGSTDSFYLEYVSAWRLAGIIPVFSGGNSGPRCGTANPPGNYEEVIGVGATTDADTLADFSSRGPGPTVAGYATQKPDVVAPGEDIYSCKGSSDNGYTENSGTSMAAPHAAGVIALMLSANPRLTYDDVFAILTRSAVTTLGFPEGRTESGVCADVPYDAVPSFHYGFGRVDALSAVTAAAAARQ